MIVDGPNQLWVADLTYVAVAVGFVYVAVIMDAWSRRIIGYAMSRRIDARLTLAALDAAIALRSPPPGCVHHTDRGSRAISTGRRNASWMEDAMARRKRGADRRLRAPFRSPRRPGVAKRGDRRRFWPAYRTSVLEGRRVAVPVD